MKQSGKDLTYFDEDGWNARLHAGRKHELVQGMAARANPPKEEIEKYQYMPHVIEPSAGADRFTLAVLCEAYTEDKVPDAKGNLEERLVMKFHPRLAPIKAAIFPLVNKDGMPEKAMTLYRELKQHFNVVYDDSGAVGRRYRRQDEVGTPFCITIDGDTLKDDTVTDPRPRHAEAAARADGAGAGGDREGACAGVLKRRHHTSVATITPSTRARPMPRTQAAIGRRFCWASSRA